VVVTVSKKQSELLQEIEETQEKLRESIEDSKKLAARSQQLLDYHRKELESSDEN